MTTYDIINNRNEKLVDRINRIFTSTWLRHGSRRQAVSTLKTVRNVQRWETMLRIREVCRVVQGCLGARQGLSNN